MNTTNQMTRSDEYTEYLGKDGKWHPVETIPYYPSVPERMGAALLHLIGKRAWWETYNDEREAIAAWNRRAEHTATRISVPREGHTSIGHYECGECRGVVGAQDAHCKHCGCRLVDS